MHPNDEREFLHEIASPLGAAIYIAEVLLDNQTDSSGIDALSREQLKELFGALKKVQIKMSARRELLIERGIPSLRGHVP